MPKKRQVVCWIVLCGPLGLDLPSSLPRPKLSCSFSPCLPDFGHIVRVLVVNFTYEWFYCISDYECNLIRWSLGVCKLGIDYFVNGEGVPMFYIWNRIVFISFTRNETIVSLLIFSVSTKKFNHRIHCMEYLHDNMK